MIPSPNLAGAEVLLFRDYSQTKSEINFNEFCNSLKKHGFVKRLFAEDEIDGQNQADETRQVVPPQGVRFHEDDGEDREDQQGDDFLDHFELPDREGASQLGAADAVGRDLETVFEQGDPPAEQDDGQHPEALYFGFESDMPVPSQCHKGIGKDQQGDGGEGTAHNSRVLRSVIEAKSSMTTSASVWVASV